MMTSIKNGSIDGRVVASTKSPAVSVVYRSTCPPPKVLGTSLIRRSIDPINSNREYVHTPQQQPRELNQSSSRNLAHIYIIYVLEKQMDRSMDGSGWQAQSPLLSVCCTEAHARPRKVLGTSLIRRSIDPINSNR